MTDTAAIDALADSSGCQSNLRRGATRAGRMGRRGPARTSRGVRRAACAFVCEVQAGYISGVNLHLDGRSDVGLV